MAGDDAESGDWLPADDDWPPADDDWNFLHEELIPALVVGGVILFLFPEPVTSTLGIVLVTIGVVLWISDVVR